MGYAKSWRYVLLIEFHPKSALSIYDIDYDIDFRWRKIEEIIISPLRNHGFKLLVSISRVCH